MHPSDSSSILRSLLHLNQPIRISGAMSSSKALLIARATHAAKVTQAKTPGSAPTIVLCPNDEEASELCGDLECLSETIDHSPLKVFHFPTWEQSPYSPIALSLRTRLARIRVLSSLTQGNLPDIIVTSISAACQATLPEKFLLEHTISVQVEHTIQSRDELIRQLLECGYLKVDPVEDPGTFAVRGDIVDVFPSNSHYPLRIELFGDFVERIREFHPSTQRAIPIQKADTKNQRLLIRIPPAREVLINSSTSSRLRERLKAHADQLDIPRTVRDPILASIRAGNYADHSDAWAPFAYDQPSTFWDYVFSKDRMSPENIARNIVWNDEFSCQQEWQQFLTEQEKRSREVTATGIILPSVESLFPWKSDLDLKIRSHSKLFLDRLELIDSDSTEPRAEKFRLAVKGNADLQKGTRHSLGELEPQFQDWIQSGFKILALASTQSQIERIRYLLEEHHLPCKVDTPLETSVITLKLGSISEGFRWPSEKLVVLTEGEILGTRHKRKSRKLSEIGSAAKDWTGLQALSDLSIGDAVVHIDHGIGRYQGLVRLDLSGAPGDFLLLEYANKDRLYIPVYRLNVIQKYVGSGATAQLDRLGGQQFIKTKEKVRETVKALAIDLIQLYAERKLHSGIRFSPRDAAFREFEAQFPFDETPDQLKAIDDLLADLESGRVMDRLICGDVGYGKTEVAIRAAFRAVSDGMQVAVLVPTTLLAQQHEQSFKARLKNYPLNIESISRFKPPKKQKEFLQSLSSGKIDIIIGTHRLLSKDVRFHNLGLVIVDEEHRFGVEHKERLKTLKVNTHVLTLTATPIPRTLHMALSGLRDISLINTPPVDRLPIRTYVSKFDEGLIQRAIEFEIARGGQVFFLHNRVQSIQKMAETIRKLVPNGRVIVGHSQMTEVELEDTMMAFYQKTANVLVCTTIIESGIDLPSANTIIINRADSFGLAQLYQIRGRVGRSEQRAYAFLLIPSEERITEEAKQRLEVIQKFVELGSGFSIASHDLEIRGGGNLLGPQQSGSIAAVGFDLYTELLEEAIRELQGKPLPSEESRREPEIKTPYPAFLGEDYVSDVHQRLSLYRRFSAATQDQEVDFLEQELQDRFGNLPAEAQNLLWLIRIKLLLKKMGIDALTVGPEKISLLPGLQSKMDPVATVALVSAHPHQYQLTPDSRLIAKVPTGTLRDLYFALEKLIQQFSRLGK